MEYTFDNCSKCDCSEKRLIVNKTRYLCEEKNRERLDKNKTPRKKQSLKSVVKSIKQSSKKGEVIEREYKKVKIEIWSEREHLCESCRGSQYLSFSHLIPRSRRKDLIAKKKNIKIHCMTFGDNIGCHDKYEAGDIGNFIDREEILEIVKELDYEFFQLKFGKYDRT